METPRWLMELCEECFCPDNFLEDMLERDVLTESQMYLDYAEAVQDLCHNACAYMVMQLHKWVNYGMEGIPLDQFFWCHGTFGSMDHSWLEFREEGQVIVIDMTVAQFIPEGPNLYIGEKTKAYGSSVDAACDDKETIMYFAESRCGNE